MRFRRPGPIALLALAVLCAALMLPVSAAAGNEDGRDEVRRVGTCTRSGEVTLHLRADDGAIEVELEIESDGRGSTWRVIILHERRLAFQRSTRAREDGSVRIRRTVPDWFGSDTLVARATSHRGETCRVSATI